MALAAAREAAVERLREMQEFPEGFSPLGDIFNPFDPEFRVDPYSVYRRLREETPIHETPMGVVILSRYADCYRILHEAKTSVDERNSDLYALFANDPAAEGFVKRREDVRPFLFMDPPDHTKLRGLVTKAFTPRVIEALRPRVHTLVDDLIDRYEGTGRMDVIEDFAYPIPVTVICEMLGVPAEDHETFKSWSRELARSLDPEFALPPEVIEQRQRAVESFAEYFVELIQERKRQPRDDLISGMIASEDQGIRLTPNELLSTCILILVAGHETTVNLIGNGVLALLRNRGEFDKLAKEPALARSAVEEVLRYDPPVQMTGRILMEDIEIDGHKIRKGQQTIILLASANRDPDQFPDADKLDIARSKNMHIAFSQGIHFCLGAPLARVEGQIALTRLAERLPQMKIETETPSYKENIVLRGLAELPVAF